MTKRLIVYVDGFNLYHGIRATGRKQLLWLDLGALSLGLCPPDHELVCVKYFTARIIGKRKGDAPSIAADRELSRLRQVHFIDAQQSKGVRVFEGRFQMRPITCDSCKTTWRKPEEKATDVQLATELLWDHFSRAMDVAVVVSADADLVPPIRKLKIDRGVHITIAFPPHRNSAELKLVASDCIHINEHKLLKAQLPDEFEHSGVQFKRPPEWGWKRL